MYGYDDMIELYDMSPSATEVSTMSTISIMAPTIISLILGIITIVAMWKIFKKAGKPGWASIIPIYNSVVMFQICGMNPWLLLLAIIPFVNFVTAPILAILINVNLAKKFGKGGGFAVGLIFLNFIFTLVLAFGDSEYQG